MRSPLTAIVFTLELTHDLNVLPALLIACTAADAVTILLLRRSILTEKVARRGQHVVREYIVDPLEILRVGEVMDRHVPTIPSSMPISELAERMTRSDPKLMHRQGTPIVDLRGQLAGIITRGDLLRALGEDPNGEITVLQAGTRELIVAYPDEPLSVALRKMLTNNVGRLPVVSRTNPHELVGYLARSGVLQARQRQFQEEHLRERVRSIPV